MGGEGGSQGHRLGHVDLESASDAAEDLLALTPCTYPPLFQGEVMSNWTWPRAPNTCFLYTFLLRFQSVSSLSTTG